MEKHILCELTLMVIHMNCVLQVFWTHMITFCDEQTEV